MDIRRASGCLAIVSLFLLAGSAAVHALEPLLVRRAVDFTVEDPQLSAICGFQILRHVEGLVDAALFFDQSGRPVREIDTSPSLTISFVALETGASVTFPGTGAAATDYGPDRTAVVALDGFLTLIRRAGQKPQLINVGRIVFTADVIGENADGLPVTGPAIEVLSATGAAFGTVVGACETLAP